LAGCSPWFADWPLSEPLSIDSDSDEELSPVSEDSESVDSVDELSDESVVELSDDSVDELSEESLDELLDDSVELESVDAGAEESAVRARAAPPENSPANTTANIAKCFFTGAQSSEARRVYPSHRHQGQGRYTVDLCGDDQ